MAGLSQGCINRNKLWPRPRNSFWNFRKSFGDANQSKKSFIFFPTLWNGIEIKNFSRERQIISYSSFFTCLLLPPMKTTLYTVILKMVYIISKLLFQNQEDPFITVNWQFSRAHAWENTWGYVTRRRDAGSTDRRHIWNIHVDVMATFKAMRFYCTSKSQRSDITAPEKFLMATE